MQGTELYRHLLDVVVALLLALGFVSPAQAAPGDLDPSFGTGGKVITDFTDMLFRPSSDQAQELALQADGKIVLAGSSYNGAGGDFALARYNPDGSLDTTFGTNGTVTTDFGADYEESATTFALQADGKIVVAGSSYNGTGDDFALARYNPDGSLDPTFGTDGIVTTDFSGDSDSANDLALQADGKIVVAGHAYTQ